MHRAGSDEVNYASRALELLLLEVAARPLYAHVATSNAASLRVLQKCGLLVERVQVSPATDRYPECEEAVLVLNGRNAPCGSDEEEGEGFVAVPEEDNL